MSISKEKNNGERYKVQVWLQRRTFNMGYYDTYDAAVAANNAAIEARNKGMMALVNHHAKHSKSMKATNTTLKNNLMPQIKTPCTMCSTIGCPKATECLRKTANVPMCTPSYPFTPQSNTTEVFLCKGFLPIPLS